MLAIFILPLAALLAFATISQAQDEQPSSVVTYTIAPSNCGTSISEFHPGNYPLINCHNLNFNDYNGNAAGSTWVYTNVSYQNPPGAFEPYGWGFFFGATDLVGAEYTVTSSAFTVDPSKFNLNSLPPYPTVWPPVCNGNCTTFTANIAGMTPDDGGTYTAALTANLYFYKGCSSGRGGGCRAIALATGGSLVVTYNWRLI